MAGYYIIGNDISPKSYALEETKAFHKALDKVGYADYVRSFKWVDKRYPDYIEGIEFIIQTSAFSKSPILNAERTCVIFAKGRLPAVFALRKDFSREMLHVNLFPKDLPVSICLYEEPYSEIRIRLTWEMLIEDIHKWYKRASDGTSHLPNQVLEPLILDGLPLLVSKKFFDIDNMHIASKHNRFMICRPIDWKKDLPQTATILIPVNTESMVSRCIHYAPQTFRELMEITKKCGVNLRNKLSDFTWQIEQLLDSNINSGPASEGQTKTGIANTFRKFVKDIEGSTRDIPNKAINNLEKAYRQITNTVSANREEAKQNILSWTPMIWLRLPKKRSEESQEQWIEDIAFLIHQSIGELCERIRIYIKQNGQMIHEKAVLGNKTDESDTTGEMIDVSVVKPVPGLDANMAQTLSGLKEEAGKYLAVGAGALGSQVITNLTRLGIGKWDVLDNDILLPHNLGRHALFAQHTPHPKAAMLSIELNSLMDDIDFSKPLLKDVLEYEYKLADYDLIFDFSASTAAVRHMAICTERPAIISAFMTKNGKYLICLYEGKEKSGRVDDIEYQLACACIESKGLNSVLEIHDEKEIRYSGACSDITTVLPQDRVAVHSGILSSFIRQDMEKAEPLISLWVLTEDYAVNRHIILPSKVNSCQIKDWNIRISEVTIKKMRACRSIRLPVETGGVLIGGFDLHNKIIYIVDIIPSPKDSVEEPYSYIRGFENLTERLEWINNVSGRRLNYVGEWHTHKMGVMPSKLDKLALNEQVAEMSLAGLPAIMIIVGDKDKYKILIKQD